MSKIRWTEYERDLVVDTAVRYFNDGGYTALEALRHAQQSALSPGRCRTMQSHSAVPDLIKMLKQRASQTVPKQKVDEVKPQEVVKANEPIDLIAQLVETITQRFATSLRESLQVAVKELEHEFKIQKHDPSYEQSGSNLPRVVIIGLLGDQVHSITREFSDRYDVKCIDTDRAMSMNPPDADAYLLMKNFINHPLYHKYQAFPNHVLIDGGMSTLRMWLLTKGKEL